MVLTTEKNKSTNNNGKPHCGSNKTFFTPCKRVGLSRKVPSTTKKTVMTNSSFSPSNNIIPQASEDKLEKINSIVKCNKSLGLSRKSAGKCDLKNVSSISDTSFNTSDVTESAINKTVNFNQSPGLSRKSGVKRCCNNLSSTLGTSLNTSDASESATIDDFNINASTSNSFSNILTSLSETSKLDKNDSEYSAPEKGLMKPEDILQELAKDKNVNDATIKSFIHNEPVQEEKSPENAHKIDKCKVRNESFKVCDKKEKKVPSKSSKKRFSGFFSTKTSTASDSEDDFISSISSSQKSNTSENNTIGNLLNCSLTIKRSDVENDKSKKQYDESKTVKSKLKKRKDRCSLDEDEFMKTIKKKRSKSTGSFSNSRRGETLKELNENICAKEQYIKNKEKTLTELTLVETYKRLHDVDKLENSTKIWKEGFKTVLIDLHSELKVNSPDCSISDLINKLHIPESIRKTCSFSDE